MTTTWCAALDELDAALGRGDADAVAQVTVDASLGPMPAELAGRAADVLDRITALERTVTVRRDAVGAELQRLGHRSRRTGPPAPSQLDCSA